MRSRYLLQRKGWRSADMPALQRANKSERGAKRPSSLLRRGDEKKG